MGILKLINDEHRSKLILGKKACTKDECMHIDKAFCTTNALDVCKYDYAACFNYGSDVCLETDHSVCSIGNDHTY